MKKRFFSLSFFMLFIFLLINISLSPAQEKVLRPCYEGNELTRVREWEKVWVGKKIDSKNIDQVKDLLPESLYQLYKDTARWGEHWFEIVPYRPYPPTPGRIKYTKEGNAKLGPKGELIDWVAGVPFPEPKSGIEAAWNFDCWSRTDGVYKDVVGYTVDGRLRYDRKVANRVRNLQFAGRVDVPPTPEYPENKKGILRCSFFEFFEPTEIKGQCGLTARYKERAKEYDTWIWIPSIRRIRRVSTAQRTDTTGGGDFCYDDNYGWDGNILRQTYKLLGRKELLFARHQDIKALVHKEGDCLWSGVQRERINVYVVEAICHDPGYIYQKTIWYLDPELWSIIHTDKYDKYGKLWKVIEQYYAIRPGYKNLEDAEFISANCVDMQRIHSTLGIVPDFRPGVELPLDLFTISNLQKYGR